MSNKPVIYVVEDDSEMCESIEMLISSEGYEVYTYHRAEDFLENFDSSIAGCLVLDIRMPGMNGLELQERLNEMGSDVPIVFITGHGDIPIAVRAMKGGAASFIEKPFDADVLLGNISQALKKAEEQRGSRMSRQAIEEKKSRLTRREKQILEMLREGRSNKSIAFELGVSQKTVSFHRVNILEKMGAKSLVDLTRMMMDR